MGSWRPAGEDGDERIETKRRKDRLAALEVHALYNIGLMYRDRGRDGEGSVMRQKEKQTKEKEKTWMGKGSVGKTV